MVQSSKFISRLRLLLVLAAAIQLVSCEGEGPIKSAYVTESGETGDFLSERDCGFSSVVAGTNSQGEEVSRVIWGFCDPVGYNADGTIWEDAWVPANTYGLIDVGADPTVIPVVTPVTTNDEGGLSGFKQLIPNTDQHCKTFRVPYPREWISSMVRMPDNEPRFETVAVLYQNFCINFGGEIIFGSSGVSLARWDADNPDALLERERLSDDWFKPGLLRDHRVPWDIGTFAYGVAPILLPSDDGTGQDLYVYQCGGGGDCSVARITLADDASGVDNAAAVADTNNWTYWTGQEWHPFPTPDFDGTCAPTALDTCGGDFPPPAVVAEARPDEPMTFPAGEVSMKQTDDSFYLLYSYNNDNGFAYRSATSPTGPFSDPVELEIAVGGCEVFCRAPIWHPELDRENEWAVSYYDRLGLNAILEVERNAGLIEMSYVAPLPPASTPVTPPPPATTIAPTTSTTAWPPTSVIPTSTSDGTAPTVRPSTTSTTERTEPTVASTTSTTVSTTVTRPPETATTSN